ncbi:hypothetical protein HanRHA438_Chr12g0548011 [Helianthus annuus]|nr:hypothetical protein HanRHA438_Chr12g0548011 [Helianthus annuus]
MAVLSPGAGRHPIPAPLVFIPSPSSPSVSRRPGRTKTCGPPSFFSAPLRHPIPPPPSPSIPPSPYRSALGCCTLGNRRFTWVARNLF